MGNNIADTQQKAFYLTFEDKTSTGKYFIKDRPVPTPEKGEVLVKVFSSGLNPADWHLSLRPMPFIREWPLLMGLDGAGIVEAIGEGVEGFGKGDRVVFPGSWNRADYATLQQYALCPADILAKIPPNVTYDEAATIPLAIVTAAVGLYFQRKSKGLEPLTPCWEEGGKGKYTGRSLVVFGGASAVGHFVIQLGKLSGFSPIVATASPRNRDLILRIGATHVVDRDGGADAVLAALAGKPAEIVYDAVTSDETVAQSWLVTASGGSLTIVRPVNQFIHNTSKHPEKTLVDGLFASSHEQPNRAFCTGLFANLTRLLATGDLKPLRVELVPKGLHGIEGALVTGFKEKKVSGYKLVIHPWETS